jgi:hypothetical protein
MHFFSVVKHLLAVAMLVWRLLRERAAVLLAMSLFAMHPSHTESVAWISVPDPLMAAGVLGSLLLYFQFADSLVICRTSARQKSPQGRWDEARYLALPGCFGVLLLSRAAVEGDGHRSSGGDLCSGIHYIFGREGCGKQSSVKSSGRISGESAVSRSHANLSFFATKHPGRNGRAHSAFAVAFSGQIDGSETRLYTGATVSFPLSSNST